MNNNKYKSCIKCGKRARFREISGHYVCYNCKYEEFIDLPFDDMDVRAAQHWFLYLKNTEKVRIHNMNK